LQTWTVERLSVRHHKVLATFLEFRKPLYSCSEGMYHSSTHPGGSLHVTQFYQAFPSIRTASDKHWGEKAWVQDYVCVPLPQSNFLWNMYTSMQCSVSRVSYMMEMVCILSALLLGRSGHVHSWGMFSKPRCPEVSQGNLGILKCGKSPIHLRTSRLGAEDCEKSLVSYGFVS